MKHLKSEHLTNENLISEYFKHKLEISFITTSQKKPGMWRFYAQLYDFLAHLDSSRIFFKELLNSVSNLHIFPSEKIDISPGSLTCVNF